MLSPLKHVLGEYKSLVVKMHMDVPKNKLVAKNLDLMCDLELGFGLPCILLMLEVVHKLIKYTQSCDLWDVIVGAGHHNMDAQKKLVCNHKF